MSWRRYLSISRPRFWLYELGTFALGVLLAYPFAPEVSFTLIALFALYFLFPGNLLIYGINDVYDYETDLRNPKKTGYEDVLQPALHIPVLRMVALTTAPFVLLSLTLPHSALVSFLVFIFFAVFYSMPPVRAKARPGLDSLFSAGHYVATGVFGFYLAGGTGDVTLLVLAGMLWATAMHAYSAVPDIEADTAAGLATVATFLGKSRTIIVCALLYLAAWVTLYLWLEDMALLLALPYLAVMAASLRATPERLWQLYTYFPWLNTVVGMVLVLTLLHLKGFF